MLTFVFFGLPKSGEVKSVRALNFRESSPFCGSLVTPDPV